MAGTRTVLTTASLWKENWEETRQRFLDWWDRKGFLIGGGEEYRLPKQRAKVRDPGPEKSVQQFYTDAVWRAEKARYDLSWRPFLADVLPVADTNIGPGSLGTFLGAEPGLTYETVWYRPAIKDPDTHPPLRFDAENRWWKIHEAIIRENVRLSEGNYYVGCPDLIENIDTLAALRGNEELMTDLVDRPAWVKAKVREINAAFFEAYERIYEMTKFEDGSAVFGAFRAWAPGKAAKVQCDASAMFSREMFAEFVAPALREQCRWLGHSMFHLDGFDCIRHLDELLAIEELDAIEWTPDARLPGGGSPMWHDLYRRILEGGKSLQVVRIEPEEVAPLLDAIGTNGVYIMTGFPDEKSEKELLREAAKFR